MTYDNKHFLINSPILEQFKQKFFKAAELIKSAISTNVPITIIHHADCDGFCAGIALEQAILPLLLEKLGSERSVQTLYSRHPSKTPFYDYADATRDVNQFMNNIQRFKNKHPLVILLDNGSTAEDYYALKKAKIYGATTIVIDHHYPGPMKEGTCKNDPYIDIHINPHLIGDDGHFSAGMLSAELARFINHETKNLPLIAAVSAIADKITGDALEQYVHKTGKHFHDLKRIGHALDYEAHHLRFNDGRYTVADILGAHHERQRFLVEEINEMLDEKISKYKIAAKKFMKLSKIGNITLVELDTHKIIPHGEYPGPGKLLGYTKEELLRDQHQPIICLGYGDFSLTFRADNCDFDANKVIKHLQEALPHAHVTGGGHAHAASIRFAALAKHEVLEETRKYIKEHSS